MINFTLCIFYHNKKNRKSLSLKEIKEAFLLRRLCMVDLIKHEKKHSLHVSYAKSPNICSLCSYALLYIEIINLLKYCFLEKQNKTEHIALY